MDRTAWKPFLMRWSEEWQIANPAEEPGVDPWLGFPAASPEEVEALERRLGCALPPSFREFLLVTNGWRDAGNFVSQLRNTDEIGWMRDLDPLMAELYEDTEDFEDEGAVLTRSLLISLEADAGVVFLDPGDVDERGEWAAYDMFSWTAMGPDRYDSFYEKMYDFYARFHALDRPQCQTQRGRDAKVEQARRASLAGEVDEPLTLLKEASRFGRDRADFLLFQMSAMLGHTDEHNRFGHLLGRGHHLSWPLDEDLFTAEILPFLFVQHQHARNWGTESTVAGLMKRGSDRVQQLIADYRTRSAEPGFQARFGNSEFDTTVRAILANSSPDDAWPLLHDAMSTWQPQPAGLFDEHEVPEERGDVPDGAHDPAIGDGVALLQAE